MWGYGSWFVVGCKGEKYMDDFKVLNFDNWIFRYGEVSLIWFGWCGENFGLKC